jgi:hypothetical protein
MANSSNNNRRPGRVSSAAIRMTINIISLVLVIFPMVVVGRLMKAEYDQDNYSIAGIRLPTEGVTGDVANNLTNGINKLSNIAIDIKNESTYKWLMFSMVLYGTFSILFISCFSNFKSTNKLYLAVANLIFTFGTISYVIEKRNDSTLNFNKWFNGNAPTMKTILVGMASSVMFGFIDNAGLFFGMDALDPIFNGWLKLDSTGNDLSGGRGVFGIKNSAVRGSMAAGLGNTFSDGMGAFLGTFAGRIIQQLTGVSDSPPIWADFLGISIGCLLGAYIPALMKETKFPC